MVIAMKDLIEKLTNAVGVSGDEATAAAAAAELLRPYGRVEADALGNILCTVKKPKEGGPHLLLDAHIDQIGLIVQEIDDKGFLKVANCGGMDRRILMASEVTVHGKRPVYGVICSQPPHLAKEGDSKKAPKLEDIAIDVGLSKEKAQELIALGDRITLSGPVREMVNGQLVSQALDDRASCAAIIRCLKLIKGKDIPCGLTVLFSTREEVGGQGARTGAFSVFPTKAIVVDVSFGYTPDSPRHKCGELGKGPMIGFAPAISRRFSNELVELAKANEIPYQVEIMEGETGTNADQIVIAQSGVETGMVSIPLKYMHTPIETVDPADIEAAARLMAACVQKGGEQLC